MKKVLITGISFAESNGKRFLAVTLNNGHSWRIWEPEQDGDGYALTAADGTGREATAREREVLQLAADACVSYLNGQEAGDFSLSYGELAACGNLADVIDWGGNIPTEDDGGPATVLAQYVENFENF